ncbi:MAG: RNA 2'-phosphotransferase [Pseudomonadota bacterium]
MASDRDISKFLSYVLRHKPDAIGLTLDAEGWADIGELIAKADMPLSHDRLKNIVATNDKKRFSISRDGLSIRANQGHSLDVDLGLTAKAPPEQLYHGTARRFLESIMKEGLLPQSRQHVHLSQDYETATLVGQRHGKPVVLTIPALEMHQHGYEFFQAQNGVWLTKTVPSNVLQSILDNPSKGNPV